MRMLFVGKPSRMRSSATLTVSPKFVATEIYTKFIEISRIG